MSLPRDSQGHSFCASQRRSGHLSATRDTCVSFHFILFFLRVIHLVLLLDFFFNEPYIHCSRCSLRCLSAKSFPGCSRHLSSSPQLGLSSPPPPLPASPHTPQAEGDSSFSTPPSRGPLGRLWATWLGLSPGRGGLLSAQPPPFSRVCSGVGSLRLWEGGHRDDRFLNSLIRFLQKQYLTETLVSSQCVVFCLRLFTKVRTFFCIKKSGI